ncbi:MAG TPA: hypothetical protein VHX88_14415 [Solirubrobacteraceae bacterium]|nr:hypothetical protein [Solirubrobacteraceae bacterium]
MPSVETVTDPPRDRRRRGAPALAAGAALIGLVLLAGCGGSSSPGVANVAASKTSSTPATAAAGAGAPGIGVGGSVPDGPGGGSPGAHFAMKLAGGTSANLLKLSACMRANGEPGFPDPSGDGSIQLSSSSGVDPNSATFQAAMQKCRKYAGGGAAQSPAQQAKAQAQALAYSACMRSHGEPSFPDPQISGGRISLSIHASSGGALDPNSPIFQAAQKACAADQPGGAP